MKTPGRDDREKLGPIVKVFDTIEHNEAEECIESIKKQLEAHFSAEIMEIIQTIIYARVGRLINTRETECDVEFGLDSKKEILKRVENGIMGELEQARLKSYWFNNSYGIW